MKEIILNTIHKPRNNYRKYTALVSDEDFGKVNQHNWCVSNQGCNLYAVGKIKRENIPMHIFITGFEQTDHIDSNGLNNQRSNLREATQKQNCMNRTKRANCSSKYKGVYWRKDRERWLAYIKFDKRHSHLGLFKSEINAAQAYNFAAEKYFGEFAKFNK